MTEQEKNGTSGGGGDANEQNKVDKSRLIVRQVEHYFGDYNLPKDKFLLEQMKLDDGWIPMETMLKFQRLASLSSDAAVIIDALKTSQSGLIEVQEEEKKIRRSPKMPVPEYNEERQKMLAKSTVYCKGFNKESTCLDELLEFFKPEEQGVINVQLRQFHDKKKNTKGFKGSIFITFKDRESAEKFMALDKVTYKEVDLERKWQEDYNEFKRQEFINKKKEKMEGKKKVKEAKEAAEKVAEEEEGLPKGAVLYIKDIGEETRREDIKEALNEVCQVSGEDIAYVYFDKGDKEAKLRFKVEDAAKEVCAKIPEAGLEIKGARVTVSLLEGEEEDDFLKMCLKDMKKWRSGGGRGGHKRRGGFRGGRGGKRQKTE